MLTVCEVARFLEEFAPPDLGEDWDNVGLLVGRNDSAVNRILTCLTLTSDVAEEAIETGAELVVTHHPVLFRGTKKITDATVEGRLLLNLIRNGIAVYSPHTRFDSADGGINQQLADGFGLHDIFPLRPMVGASDGAGSGRFGSLPESLPLKRFLEIICQFVEASYVEHCGREDATVSRVGIACGAAGEFLEDAIARGCDTFVTGEARFHTALQARSEGVNLVLLGHYSSERFAVENLADVLKRQFPAVDVSASQQESDPLTVYQR